MRESRRKERVPKYYYLFMAAAAGGGETLVKIVICYAKYYGSKHISQHDAPYLILLE